MMGRVVVRAFPMEGGRSVWQYEVQEGVNVASLCVGLTPEEGVNVLSRVFGLCRSAHTVAARQALGVIPTVTSGYEGRKAQVLEILRDHAIAFFLHLPPFFGLPSDRLLVQQLSTGCADQRTVLGDDVSLAEMNACDLTYWLKESQKGEKTPLLLRLLACLRQKILPTWGRGEFPAIEMSTLMKVEENIISSGYDASLWPDYALTPLLQSVVAQDGGVSLFARILARVLDMIACLDGDIMMRPAAWLSGEVLPQGWGLTRAARGVLFHKADVQAGKIKAYTVISPTQWHISTRKGMGGMMDRLLATLPLGEEGRLTVQVLLCALNPCVPVTVCPTV